MKIVNRTHCTDRTLKVAFPQCLYSVHLMVARPGLALKRIQDLLAAGLDNNKNREVFGREKLYEVRCYPLGLYSIYGNSFLIAVSYVVYVILWYNAGALSMSQSAWVELHPRGLFKDRARGLQRLFRALLVDSEYPC